MILKDLMEEKQLNFNQPLLSVRRFSSTVASETELKRKSDNNAIAKLAPLPTYKSELKSGPVRNAGNVPFVWEKIPGKPKDESKSEIYDLEHYSILPNPPSRRISKIKQQDSDVVSKVWSSTSDMRNGSTVFNSEKIASLLKDETQEKESSDSYEAYVDAPDTLSRTESYIMSCNLSGLDDQELQPAESFSSDRRERDFMIDRFLPAAKATTSEKSEYTSQKKLVGQEQQKQMKKVVNTERSCSLNKHRPKALPHYNLLDIGRQESEDESDDSNEGENYTNKACGLFPRFCLLNPIPGLRMEDKVLSNNAVHGMQAKSAASHIGTTKRHARAPNNVRKLADSKSGFTEEREILGIPVKSKHGTQHESCYESPVVDKTLYVDSIHKVKSQTNHIEGDSETLRKDCGIYKNPSKDSSLENSKHLDVKEALTTNSSDSLYSPFLICSENSTNGMKIDSQKHKSDLNQDLVAISSSKVVQSKRTDLESQVKKVSDVLTQNSEVDLKSRRDAKLVDQESTFSSSNVPGNAKIDLKSECLRKLGHQERSDERYFQLPLILPSLKAPSESWLKRTLATISSKNINSWSNLSATNSKIYARNQYSNTASLCPK